MSGQRRLEHSAPNRIVIADASGGTLAVPTFASRWGVTGVLDPLTGAPVIRPQDEMHLDHRQVRVHDMQQSTPAGVPDRRLTLQQVNDYGAEYEDGEPAQSIYGQSFVFTAKNRSTRHVDGSKEALPGSLQRIVGSEDNRYALALTLNEIGLDAPGAKESGRAPDGSVVVDLPIPEGVVFREPSPGAQGLNSLRGVVSNGLFIPGEAAQNAARAAINGGGNAGDVSRWALAASKGQPPPPLEGRNLPETEERPAEEEPAPAGPDQIPANNKPAGYVRGPNKTGLLGTTFTTEASALIHVGRDGEQIGTLPHRHDFQIALDDDRRATLGINDADCAGLSEGSGEEIKGWLQPDTSQAGQDTALPGKDSALRPVIKVPKPDAITIPPPLPPPSLGPQCQPPKKPEDPPDDAEPDPKAAIAAAEKAEAAAQAAANEASAKADAAAQAAAAAKADPTAKAGQGGPEERNAAGAAANAAREARSARRAAEQAHDALEQAKSRGDAAQKATDAARASGTGATNAIARVHQRRAVEAANRAARAATQAAARAQRSADRAAKANVRANRAALTAAIKAQARAERAARQALHDQAKANKTAREFPNSAEAKAAKAAADEAVRNTAGAVGTAENQVKGTRKTLEDAKAGVTPVQEGSGDGGMGIGPTAEEADAKEAEEDKEAELVGSAIGRCAVEEGKKQDDDAPFIVIGGHLDGSKWIAVHEGDNSLLFRKIGPGGQTQLGAVRIGTDGELTSIAADGTETSVGSGGGLTSPVAVADGGTGATTPAGARANLGTVGYLTGQCEMAYGSSAANGCQWGDWGRVEVAATTTELALSIGTVATIGAAMNGNDATAYAAIFPNLNPGAGDPVVQAFYWFKAGRPIAGPIGPDGLRFRMNLSGVDSGNTFAVGVFLYDPTDASQDNTDAGPPDYTTGDYPFYGPFNRTQYSADTGWITFQVDQADIAGIWSEGDIPAFMIVCWQDAYTAGDGAALSVGVVSLDMNG